MQRQVWLSLAIRVVIAVVLAGSTLVYAAALEITNVTPSRGATTGGTTVFISGSGFTGATQVLFGATPATSFTVNNDTSIQATAPSAAAGVVNISVVTPEGTVTLEEAYGFGAIPTALADSYSTPFGTTLVVNSPGVLTNDDATGGGGVVVEIGANVTNGALTLTPDGGFSYVPNSGFAGTDRFTYRSRNNTGFSNFAAVTIAVGVPSGPLPPSALQVVSVIGNRLTLRWTPPLLGPTPTGYVIEGGVSPGEVAGTVQAGVTPLLAFDAPSGTFFIRVRTIAGTVQSAPSNEVTALVNVPAPPSAPEGLLGSVNGNALTLAWRNSFAGGAPTGLVLDVTGSLTTSMPLAVTDMLHFAGVPSGTYTLSLRAVNTVGSSPPSTPVTLTFPSGCGAVPQPPVNFVAFKDGATIRLVWDPPASGEAPTGYVVHVSGSAAGSFATAARTMSGTVGAGTYILSVAATNPCGASTATPTQTVVVSLAATAPQ